MLTSIYNSKQINKACIVIVSIFFLSCSYVTFFVDNPSADYDILFYYYAGEQILSGDGVNVQIANGPVGWPVTLAAFDLLVNDPFVSAKIFSVIFSTGIVIVTYFIIKNIFNRQIAFLGLIICAVNPTIHKEAILTHSEMLPVFLIFVSLYFITKKEFFQRDVILCGLFLGLSFMLRPQSLLIGMGVLFFILSSIKKQKKQFTFFLIATFLITISPLLAYNLTNTGDMFDLSPDFYLLNDSHSSEKEYFKNRVMPNNTNFDQTYFDFSKYFTDYAENVSYYNPHMLFNLSLHRDNVSPIPYVPFNGFVLILGGLIGICVTTFSKRFFIPIGISLIITFYLLITDILHIYFFLPIIIPVIIIVGISYDKIPNNLKPLLFTSLFFMLIISIVKIARPQDMSTMLIITCIFSSFFILDTIPKILQRLSKNRKWNFNKIKTPIIVSLILFIIIMNLATSYNIEGRNIHSTNVDIQHFFDENQKFILESAKYVEIGNVLLKEPDIENKFIMADSNLYAYYGDSNLILTTFREGTSNDTVLEFTTRQNWSDFELYFSNINSVPQDRYGTRNSAPDYLIYEIQERNNTALHVLDNHGSSKIPSNFELLYISNDQNTIIYKIHN